MVVFGLDTVNGCNTGELNAFDVDRTTEPTEGGVTLPNDPALEMTAGDVHGNGFIFCTERTQSLLSTVECTVCAAIGIAMGVGSGVDRAERDMDRCFEWAMILETASS